MAVVRWIFSEPASAAATALHSVLAASKSASIPPCIIMSSVNWVSTTPREPPAMASLTAWVWVMDLPTTDMNASLAFMAAETGAGGSWPSVSRGTMTCRMGSAWTRYTAAAMASAMDRRDASVMISTFSPGFTLTQVDTTLSAPRAISIFFILLPPFQ